ncbi:MAG: hypothetical protein M1321_01095 [Candidatus Marsarchaeota archaeon]|nr:hypothetical protein [Candidatus Marsarchaeota archaeon]
MRLRAFLAVLAVAVALQAYAAGMSAQGYTAKQANLTIQNISAYIQTVNESSFLVFSPNLTQAYYYLGKARAYYNKSPSLAVQYAFMANSSAMAAYDSMGKYRNYAILAMLVFTGVVGFLLYVFARRRGRYE